MEASKRLWAAMVPDAPIALRPEIAPWRLDHVAGSTCGRDQHPRHLGTGCGEAGETEYIIASLHDRAIMKRGDALYFRAMPPVAALDQLLEKFDALARQVARTRGLDATEVDDVVQDVRVRLWKAHPTGENLATVTASYFVRVVTSAVVDHLRRKRRHAQASLDAEQTAAAMADTLQLAPTDQSERDALASTLRRALDALAPNRRVLVLLHLEGYTREDMSSMTGWSESKVRNLLHRGLDDLREALSAMEGTA